MKSSISLLLALMGVLPLAAKPNVVLIMADDFGVGCSNVYGASDELVRTPALNRLAKEGMLFTDASSPASVCSPTRYALITGRYAWRGPLSFGVVNPEDPMVIETDRMTMPRYFQRLGYQTAQIGKWHLGYGSEKPVDYTSKLTPGPNDLGFDYHFGLPQNLDDKIRVWIENDGIYGLRSKKVSPYSKSFYGGKYMGFDAPQRQREKASEHLTDRAIDWIKRAHRGNPERPFFLYFAPPATHHPIEPSEEMRGSSGCGAFGDFIQDLDLSVNRIVNALEYEGIAKNTLVIFTADNGADVPTNDPMRPENQAVRAGLNTNGVFRGDKHTIYEGGARVPLLVRWDGKVAAGSESDRMVSIVDLYATIVEAVSGTPPSAKDAPDSVSFAPTLMGETQGERSAMVTSNVAGLHSIREGEWKFIDGTYPQNVPRNLVNSTRQQAEPSLYNLDEDPGETKNLIQEHPEIAERLRKSLDGLRSAPTRK